MSNAQFFVLAAFIYLAPHTEEKPAILWGLIFLCAAGYFRFSV